MVKQSKKKTKKKTGKKGGPPTKYKPELNKLVEVAASQGLIDKEIYEMLGISKRTFQCYQKRHPLFSESLKKGKEIADSDVVRSLYQRACGYSHPDVHISQFEGSVIKTPIIKHYPPDTTACIFWLKNRQKERWRDKYDHEVDASESLAKLLGKLINARSS